MLFDRELRASKLIVFKEAFSLVSLVGKKQRERCYHSFATTHARMQSYMHAGMHEHVCIYICISKNVKASFTLEESSTFRHIL